MLDIKLIRSQPELIDENCRKRNVNVDINKLLKIDEKVRCLRTHGMAKVPQQLEKNDGDPASRIVRFFFSMIIFQSINH